MSAPPVAEFVVAAVYQDDDGSLSAAGTIATGSLKGVRAAVGPILPCGECPVCRRGGAAACPNLGVLQAEEGRAVDIRERWLIPLSGAFDIPAPLAAIAVGPWARAYAMYAEAGLGPREPAVVIGDGATANALVAILLSKSIRPVVVAASGSAPATHARAAQLPFVDATLADAAQRIAELAQSESTEAGIRPMSLLVAGTSDSEREVALAVAARPRTTVVIRHRLGGGDLRVPAAALAAEARLIGLRHAHPDLAHELLALVARGELASLVA